jgi:hypothetical protein
MLVCVAVSPATENDYLFFLSCPSAAWIHFVDVTGATLQTNLNAYGASGYVLISLSTYANGFTFSAVIALTPNAGWAFAYGLTDASTFCLLLDDPL